jgi:hypothetical protein
VAEGQARDVRIINAWVAGVSAAGGIGVALGGPSPTGSTFVDVLLLVVAVGLCIGAIATAPWLRRWADTPRPIITAAVVAVGVQALARLGNLRFFGVSAVVGIAPVLALTCLAIQRRSGQRRLQLWAVFGGIVAVAILALLGFGVAAAAARAELTRGTDEAKNALEALKAGDLSTARRGFQLAAQLLGDAGDDLDAPWAQPARLVPVLAQHRRAASDLADSAATVSITISDVLGEIDFDRLRIVNGAIDLAAVTALKDPIEKLNAAVVGAADAGAAVGSAAGTVESATATVTPGSSTNGSARSGRPAMATPASAPTMITARANGQDLRMRHAKLPAHSRR